MRACQVADVQFDNVSTSLCFGTNTHYTYWHNMSDTYSISAERIKMLKRRVNWANSKILYNN